MSIETAAPAARVPLLRRLYVQVLIGILLGVALGHFYPTLGTDMKPLAGMNVDPATLDGKSISAYTSMAESQHTGAADFLMNVIPKSVVGSFAEGNVLQILLFAVLFGAAMSRFGDRVRPFIDMLDMFLHGMDGEMHGDLALDGQQRQQLMPRSALEGDANLLVFPNMDAANIAYNLLKVVAGGSIAIGPILLGAAAPVHVLTASTTVRRIVNMTALTVADANAPVRTGS